LLSCWLSVFVRRRILDDGGRPPSDSRHCV
jgi:hypothetical protein